MEKYEVTIMYKAVITVNVKASSREEAEKKAEDIFRKHKGKLDTNKIIIQDDIFKSQGVLCIDKTWGQL